MGFRDKLSDRPLLTALIIYAVYTSMFVVLGLIMQPEQPGDGINGVEGALSQWPVQVFFSLFFIAILSSLGWWKKIGFVTPNPGGLKYLVPPLLYVGLLFYLNWQSAENPMAYFSQSGRTLQLLALLVMTLGVGFTEESMYRGILFFGLNSKLSTLVSVIIVSVIFGVFHYVNLFTGAGLYDTDYQVLHAIAAGFMYMALRLRVGAIWAVMIFHGIWDFAIFLTQSIGATHVTDSATSIELNRVLIVIAPALIYGVFVYWRWSVWNGRQRG